MIIANQSRLADIDMTYNRKETVKYASRSLISTLLAF